ncbi:YlbE-like family protein [Ornithinibacillus scapharcae]|uniref:YlbE-like family protein n=1 Tax=Ornithinibacillus scapharcae TaxID=1147159 RepID=UPI000225B8BE|nr:YlbE-like family protein [Ornithinibacillus scapharcae]
MNQELRQFLTTRPDLINFIRFNPIWYRYLSRDPLRITEMEKEAKRYYGKTLSQKVEKVGNNVQMLSMLLQFTEMMKD